MSLSPGRYHEQVPRDPVKNLRFRIEILKAAQASPAIRAGLMEMCRLDILFYVNVFVIQNNPKKDIGFEAGPFITWPFQDRAILSDTPGKEGILWCIEHREDLVIEKSREMGATWICLLVSEWLCRFKRYHDSLMMSKSADAVDNNSRNCLFGKMRFIHEHLPDWMLGKMTDNKFYFGYESTQSSILGQASTGKAGVSERCQEMFIDETAQIKDDWEVVFRTNATAGCRIFNSTHTGLGTAFYALTTADYFKKLIFHWTQHPDKNQGMYRYNQDTCKIEFLRYNEQTDQLDICDQYYHYPPDFAFDLTGAPTGGPHPGVRSPWYDKEYRRMHCNDSEMAKDHDINPKGSVSQFYPPLLIKRLKDQAADPWWEGDLTYDKETGEPKELVEVKGGPIKLWCHVNHGKPPPSFYGGGCDISQGTGATPSCFSLADGRIGKKVLEYSNAHIDPRSFGVLVVALCRLFKDEEGEGAWLAWEHHGPGTPFGIKVWKELGYRNLYRKTAEHDLRQTVSETPGWNPGGANKLNLHTEYRAALHDGEYLNLSERALDECLAFRHIGNTVEHSGSTNTEDPTAARENHGDLVVADALSWKMIKDSVRVKKVTEKPPEQIECSIQGRRRMREQRRRQVAW